MAAGPKFTIEHPTAEDSLFRCVAQKLKFAAIENHLRAFFGDLTTGLPGVTTDSISIADAQSQVDQWIKSIGVRYFSELTNLAQLVEEVGELARVISRTYGEQSFKDAEGNSELADEMADVLFVLICLANQTGVDLTEAFRKNLVKKTARDKDRHQNNPKLK